MEGRVDGNHPQVKHLPFQQRSVAEEWSPADRTVTADVTPRRGLQLPIFCHVQYLPFRLFPVCFRPPLLTAVT